MSHSTPKLEPGIAGTKDMPSGKSSRHTSLTLDSTMDIIKSTSDRTPQIAETSSTSSVSKRTVPAMPMTTSSRPPLAILLAYTALCISIFLVALDTVLIPTALPTISESFHISDSFNRSFYLGIVGAVWAVASALGPVLGGVFAQNLNWRWCFYINLPIVSFTVVLLYFTLHLHNPRTPFLAGMYTIDWIGTFTILAATILFLVGLQTGGTKSWSTPLVMVFLALGIFAYVLFPLTQWYEDKRGGSPIMPLRIFRDRSNLSALAVCAFDALVFNSIAYFVPLYFQIVAARGPSTTGVLMLALAIPLTIVSFLSGLAIEKTGRFMDWMQSGLVLTTAGVGAMASLTQSSSLAKPIGFLILIGAGFGPTFHTPLIALQTRISEKDMGVGTATFGFVRMLSGAIGVVIGQVIFQGLMSAQLPAILAAGVPDELAQQLAGGEAVSLTNAVALLDDAQRVAVMSGFMSALRGAFICYAVVAALGVAATFGIKRVTLKRDGGDSGSTGEAVAKGVVDVESARGSSEGVTAEK
ncbi:hypothetical protein E8E13_007961 [Curvularia kusanoi]|uniref:Major facilitator superfamily (MFS) profile domain-containing protein n=1 Tax=Curvularia kusanoi TaxID=90978 RepID=A0A9P4TLL1_CURKU|nr:hypothetical protein E8E13_007961 [Curvularia kusanoi]